MAGEATPRINRMKIIQHPEPTNLLAGSLSPEPRLCLVHGPLLAHPQPPSGGETEGVSPGLLVVVGSHRPGHGSWEIETSHKHEELRQQKIFRVKSNENISISKWFGK